MTQITPNNKVTSPESKGSSKMPAIAINENTGTVNIYVGSGQSEDASPIRDIIAPDAASQRVQEQLQAMQALNMIPDTTQLALANEMQAQGIPMPVSAALGQHTAQVKDQQLEALSQTTEGPAQGQ